MKITTFFWGTNPIEMVLINTVPQANDFTGFSMFGFSAFDLLLAIDAIAACEVDKALFYLDAGYPLPRSVAEVMFTSFCHEDIITEGDTAIMRPYVSVDGAGKLGDLLPCHLQLPWYDLLNEMLRTMQLCCFHARKAINDRSHEVTIAIEEGKTETRRFTPQIPARSLALIIQQGLLFGGLDERVTSPKLAFYCAENKAQFVSENDLAQALTAVTDKVYDARSLRSLLVERGYLTVKRANGRSRYVISKQGSGYGVMASRQRQWHMSMIKLLGKNE